MNVNKNYQIVFKGDKFAVLDENGDIAVDGDGKKISHRIKGDAYLEPAKYDWKHMNRLYWK